MVLVQRCFGRRQTFTVPSQLALARRLPSGLKLTLVTLPEWPLRQRLSLPVWASQTFTVWSSWRWRGGCRPG